MADHAYPVIVADEARQPELVDCQRAAKAAEHLAGGFPRGVFAKQAEGRFSSQMHGCFFVTHLRHALVHLGQIALDKEQPASRKVTARGAPTLRLHQPPATMARVALALLDQGIVRLSGEQGIEFSVDALNQ